MSNRPGQTLATDRGSLNAECPYQRPTVPKPRRRDERRGFGPGSREWWERYWTDALERLKRYLEEGEQI
jgi:hypothetical protein